jgi:medium-chain acyl-[acyl-carrier-protein] hydrolase
LPDAEFIRVMAERYQGIPAEVLGNRELLTIVLPALRADMTMIETYEYRESAPLTCEITALGGDHDPHADASDLEGWRDLTTGTVTCRRFPGGHFYLTDARADVVQMFRGRLVKLAGPARHCP